MKQRLQKITRPVLMIEELHKVTGSKTLFRSSRTGAIWPLCFGFFPVMFCGTFIFYEIDYILYSSTMQVGKPKTEPTADLAGLLLDPFILILLFFFFIGLILLWRGLRCLFLPITIQAHDENNVRVVSRNLLFRTKRVVPLQDMAVVGGSLATLLKGQHYSYKLFLTAGKAVYLIGRVHEIEEFDVRAKELASHITDHYKLFNYEYYRFRPLLPDLFFS